MRKITWVAIGTALACTHAIADPHVGQEPEKNQIQCQKALSTAARVFKKALNQKASDRALKASWGPRLANFVQTYEQKAKYLEGSFFTEPAGSQAEEKENAAKFESYIRSQVASPTIGGLGKLDVQVKAPDLESSTPTRTISITVCPANGSDACVSLQADHVIRNTSANGLGLTGVGGTSKWANDVKEQTNPNAPLVPLSDLPQPGTTAGTSPYTFSSLDEYQYGPYSFMNSYCPADMLAAGSDRVAKAQRENGESVYSDVSNVKKPVDLGTMPNDNNIQDGTSANGARSR